MKVRTNLLMLLLMTFALTLGCEPYSRDEINQLLESDNPNNLVKAFYLIGERKDSFYIPVILKNASDPRVAHTSEFKGISVYQSKMIAMKKISGLPPPGKITYKPDSSIIKFYSDWVKE